MQARIGIWFSLWLLCALLVSCVDTDSPVIVDLNPPLPGSTSVASDSIPPSSVETIALTYFVLDQQLFLEWTAPSDDTPDEPVSRYEIRYTRHAPFSWDAAIPVIDPPMPNRPGESERYRFHTIHNSESLYCAIRCADEAGNRSPVSAVAALQVPGYTFEGRCWDLYSTAPTAGVQVTLIAADTIPLVTGADGTFRWDDLPLGPIKVMIAGFDTDSIYHDIDYTFDLTTHMQQSYPMIPVRPIDRNPVVSRLALFRAATEPCKIASSLFLKWRERPVKIYVPDWVNEYGIDYRVHAVDALTRWMVRTGCDLFTIVDEPPESGVIMHFKPREEMGSLVGITRHTFDPAGYPLMDDVEIVDDFGTVPNLYRIMLHELGHTIRLCHLNFREYIMFPTLPLPPDISDDEVAVVRMHEALPSGIDMSIYVDVTIE